VKDEHADALAFAACGSPIAGHEIRIVSPEGRELPERAEGRVEFHGPSATSGYYRNPAKTRELFDGEWLDTGDLGYVAGGDLFITSRAKDVIIRGGQHVHPYEVEEAVGQLPGVRKGCVAVFGVHDAASGTEKVVVVAETRLAPGPDRDALRGKVADTALAILGTPADDVVIAPPHAVLKTSSGKIRRAASREAYERGLAGKREPAAWRGLARFALSLAGARLRRTLRWIGGWLYGAYLWLAAAVLGCVALLAATLPTGPRWRALHALTRAMAAISGLPIAAHGLENVPASGPAILVANHASYVDSPVLFALLARRARFVAKRELARNPVMRFVLRAAGAVFIERFDVERGAEDTRELVRLAREGEMLVFFAEGTFTRAPGLMPFHMGAFVAAAETGAPVVPVALRGTRSVLRDGQWLPRRGAIHLSAAAPRTAEGNDWRSAVRLRDAVRADILALCGEPDLAQTPNRPAP
jgi:1-acyl-sn-glycerol-3-phosphate acyltransferase